MKDLFEIKNIVFIGAGFVGAITSIVLANKCPHLQITVIDKNEDKIKSWNSDNIPLFEPSLKELLHVVRNKNLTFTPVAENCLSQADMVFICVNTPTKNYGIGKGRAPDMSYIESAALMIRLYCEKNKVIVVEKSTVPVKSAEKIAEILLGRCSFSTEFFVISNPEFLSQGNAVKETMFPDRILIGGMKGEKNAFAIEALKNIYLHWVPSEQILVTDVWSAELSKLAANAFLAQRISSINSISAICFSTGANIQDVSKSIGMDSRIGNKHIMPSLGFGGSCFKKDLLCLVYICESLSLPDVSNYWHQVLLMNNYQMKRFVNLIISEMFENIKRKVICIFGATYKKNTSDLRDSPALYVMKKILKEEARITIVDPQAVPSEIFIYLQCMLGKRGNDDTIETENQILIETDPYRAAENCHAIVICTEWDIFKNLDYKRIHKSMQKPAYLFDGRLLLENTIMKGIGFNYFSL